MLCRSLSLTKDNIINYIQKEKGRLKLLLNINSANKDIKNEAIKYLENLYPNYETEIKYIIRDDNYWGKIDNSNYILINNKLYLIEIQKTQSVREECNLSITEKWTGFNVSYDPSITGLKEMLEKAIP